MTTVSIVLKSFFVKVLSFMSCLKTAASPRGGALAIDDVGTRADAHILVGTTGTGLNMQNEEPRYNTKCSKKSAVR
eukprot:6462131-Amphidinium_carterae.1